jgi:hypothetical protein
MPIDPKPVSRNVRRTQSAADTSPQAGLTRRGIALAQLCVVICCLVVFCAAAFAQSDSIPIDPKAQFVSEVQPASEPAAALPVEPGVSRLTVSPSPELQPGDFGFAPLRTQDRTSLFFKGYLASPMSYFAMAASAGVGFGTGEPEGWGRTLRGFGQRGGTEFVLYTAEEALHDVGDAALGLDPRYFACRCTGLWHRSGHAVKMTLLAYDGNGRLHLDLPRFAGDYGGSMLVTTWYPAPDSPLDRGVKMGHVQIGLDAGTNLLREFSPEIKHFFRALKLAKPATP